MKKYNISEGERKMLEEDIAFCIECDDEEYFEKHHKHLSEAQKQKLHDKYFKQKVCPQETKLTMSKKDKLKADYIFKLMQNESLHLSGPEMVDLLAKSGLTGGKSLATVHRALIPMLKEMGAKKDDEQKWYADPLPPRNRQRNQKNDFPLYQEPTNMEDKILHYLIIAKKKTLAEDYVKHNSLGSNYELRQTEEGTEIRFDSRQYINILRWVLSWGSAVRPVAPHQLVDDWKYEIFSIMESLNQNP